MTLRLHLVEVLQELRDVLVQTADRRYVDFAALAAAGRVHREGPGATGDTCHQ